MKLLTPPKHVRPKLLYSNPSSAGVTDRYTDRKADRQSDTQTDRQTNRQTDRQTDRQADRQTDRQTNLQACPQDPFSQPTLAPLQ